MIKKTALAAFLLSVGALGSAHAASGVITIKSVEAQLANKLVSEAVSVCAANGHAVTATVVNGTGQPIAVLRGDGAAMDTVQISQGKAYTIFSWGTAFHKDTTSELSKAGIVGPANGSLTTIAKMLPLPGGIVLKSQDQIIGGLGVSGAPDGMDDEKCAAAAIEKYKSQF